MPPTNDDVRICRKWMEITYWTNLLCLCIEGLLGVPNPYNSLSSKFLGISLLCVIVELFYERTTILIY